MRLFDSGRRMLEDICGVPVLGVIPYFKDIHIEEEDSVALAQKSFERLQGRVNIAVVMLRHLSNYTDFDALEQDPRVHLFYTNNVEDIRKADIIILPGTKSTLHAAASDFFRIPNFFFLSEFSFSVFSEVAVSNLLSSRLLGLNS